MQRATATPWALRAFHILRTPYTSKWSLHSRVISAEIPLGYSADCRAERRGKAEVSLRQVGTGKTNASEPPLKRRVGANAACAGLVKGVPIGALSL